MFRRFGGIMAAFSLTVGFFVLGFAAANPALMFLALLCWWPMLVGVIAWTARGLRDHYQLVPKQPDQRTMREASPRVRTQQRQQVPEDFN